MYIINRIWLIFFCFTIFPFKGGGEEGTQKYLFVGVTFLQKKIRTMISLKHISMKYEEYFDLTPLTYHPPPGVEIRSNQLGADGT